MNTNFNDSPARQAAASKKLAEQEKRQTALGYPEIPGVRERQAAEMESAMDRALERRKNRIPLKLQQGG